VHLDPSVFGGVVVGMTSVGSGSLMVVALLFLYPRLRANELVGTDLTQAVPLTLAAAGGALLFGHVDLSVTYALVIGGVPAVIIGSLFSSRVPDPYVRPVITFVIFISGTQIHWARHHRPRLGGGDHPCRHLRGMGWTVATAH